MSTATATAPEQLPRWLWLWFPPVLVFLLVPIKIVSPEFYASWMDGELGLIELATPLISLAGAVVGIKLMRKAAALPTRRLRLWMLLMTLSCIYFAGEELSWGQHLFGWGTPEYLEAVNDQEETNLHNISSWFDQKPRLILELWVLIGGVLWPLRCLTVRGGASQSSGESDWFLPTIELLPTALLAIIVRLPERIKSLFEIEQLPLEFRFSEPQEYYFALFLLIYLASVHRRLK